MTEEFLFDGSIRAFRLSNDRLCATLLTYGATLQSLTVDGAEVVCGYDDIASYRTSDGYLGATVGRYANRISGGKFRLGGKEYVLERNEKGSTHIHGGLYGFDRRIWNARAEGDSVIMTLFSPDGEGGYPGNLNVSVTFTLTKDALRINYRALSDADTVLNLTNHSYFNLNGAGEGTVRDHVLTLNADSYDEVDALLIPVRRSPVDGTPFDFREGKAIGRDIDADDEQLRLGSGYDHNFYINGSDLRFAARLCARKTMELYTDMPCVQIYTANFLADGGTLSSGKAKVRNGAVCLETQFAPDSPNRSADATLKSGEVFDRTAVFRFL